VAAKAKRARLLTPDELAEFLNVSPRTIDTWRYQRKGPRAVRVGGVLRFRESDIEAWLEANADPEPWPHTEPDVRRSR
jgi:excisionase family DNA binding protein